MKPEDIAVEVAKVFEEEGEIGWISVSITQVGNVSELKVSSSKHSPNVIYGIGIAVGVFCGFWIGTAIGMI